MKRWMAALVTALAALWLLPAESRALGFQVSGGGNGNSLEVNIRYDGSYGRIDACVFCVDFDCELLEFEDTQKVSGGYLVNTVENGSLRSVYSSWSDGGGLGSASFEFRAAKGADITRARVRVWVEQTAAPVEVPDMAPVSVSYEGASPASSEADLLVLRPSAGELEPEFSPDILEYRVEVPYSVEEMSFGMSASPGARVSVNRKNLGSGGSSTPFRLTVTAEDGVTKRVYTVTVHRGEYAPPTPKPTATPKPTGTPKPTATPKPTKTPASEPSPSKTPKPTKTPTSAPSPSKTPKASATPKATKTPKPSATPKPTKAPSSDPKPGASAGPGPYTPGPGGTSEASSQGGAPLTEVVTIERKSGGGPDRLLAGGGVLAAILAAAVIGTLAYEGLSRRREEQLKGGKKK